MRARATPFIASCWETAIERAVSGYQVGAGHGHHSIGIVIERELYQHTPVTDQRSDSMSGYCQPIMNPLSEEYRIWSLVPTARVVREARVACG
jgi:hypothetical protein